MKQVIFLLSILVLRAGEAFAQTDFSKTSIETLVTEIMQYNKLHHYFIGLSSDEATEQYKRYEAIKQKATKDDLLQLTDHANPVVRCYAFMGLVERKEDGLYPIIEKHLSDTTIFKQHHTCVIMPRKVVDFYTSYIKPRKGESETEEEVSLSPQEYEKLDSLVLYLPHRTDYLEYQVLNNVILKPAYYQRIRELVQTGMYQALPALTKYQKQEDIPLMLSFSNSKLATLRDNRDAKYSLCEAIQSFKHESFIPFLEAYSQEILDGGERIWLYAPTFYKTCILYNQKKTLDLIEDLWNRQKEIDNFKAYYQDIRKALHETPTPENKALREKFL